MVVKTKKENTGFIWSFLGLLLALPFVSSFIVSLDFSDCFNTPKHFYFIFLMLPLLGFFILKDFLRKFKSKADIYLVDFLFAIYFIYSSTSIYLFRGELFGNIRYVNFFLCSLIYYLSRVLLSGNYPYINKKDLINTTFALLLFFGTMQAWYGILQYFGILKNPQLEFRISGAYGNPGPYANILSVFTPVAISYILFHKTDIRIRILAWISFISILVALPLTLARTAWIATFVGVFYVFMHHNSVSILIKKFLSKTRQKIIATGLVVLLGIASVFILTSFKEDSVNGRLFIWKVTASMIADSPIFGHGFDSFIAVHNNFQADYFRNNPDDIENAYLADGINYAFNEYLQIAAELGFLGLILFICLFVIVFWNKRKNYQGQSSVDMEVIAAEGMILIILILSFFSYPLHSLNISAMLFFALGIVVTKRNEIILFSFSTTPVLRKIESFGLLFVFSMIVMISYSRFQAEKEWVKAFQMVRKGRYDEAKELFRDLYPIMRYSQYFLFNYGAELSIMNEHEQSIKILDEVESKLNDSDYWIYKGNSHEALGNFELAIDCFIQASYIMPVKFYPKYRLVLIYDKLGDIKKALSFANEVVNMEVKVESEIVNSIRIEMEEYVKQHAEGLK